MDPDASEAEPDIRDSRRKWLALASVVTAVGMTAVWAYFLRDAALRGDRLDSFREAGEMGRALGVFGIAVLFGGAACIRRKQRSWTTFLTVYTGILVLEGSHWFGRLRTDADVAVDQFLTHRVASEQPERFRALEERRRHADQETARLQADLERTPPLSPEGLKSVESISTSESRITDLLAAEDAVDEIGKDAENLGLVAEGDDTAKLMPLSAHQEAATRELFIALRDLLRHLRTTWGAWKFDAGSSSIRYSADANQDAYDQLFRVLATRRTNLADLAAEIRARQVTHP